MKRRFSTFPVFFWRHRAKKKTFITDPPLILIKSTWWAHYTCHTSWEELSVSWLRKKKWKPNNLYSVTAIRIICYFMFTWSYLILVCRAAWRDGTTVNWAGYCFTDCQSDLHVGWVIGFIIKHCFCGNYS